MEDICHKCGIVFPNEADKKQRMCKAFETQLNLFKRSADPAIFGRLEGMKEFAEIMGWDDLVNYIEVRSRQELKDF